MEAAGRRKNAAAARATTKASQVGACTPRSRKSEKGRGEQTPRREERSAKQEKAVGRPPCPQKTRPTRCSAPAAPPPLAREKLTAPFSWGGAAQQVMTAQAVQAQRIALFSGSPSHPTLSLRRVAVHSQAPPQRPRRLQRRCWHRRHQKATAARQKEAFPSPWRRGGRPRGRVEQRWCSAPTRRKRRKGTAATRAGTQATRAACRDRIRWCMRRGRGSAGPICGRP